MRHGILTLILLVGMGVLLISGCNKDEDNTVTPPATIPPITANLFPTIAGHQFVYVGYGIMTNGAAIPDPNHVYKTVWTIGPTGSTPVGIATTIVDTTTLQGSTGTVGKKSYLFVKKDSATGDVQFMQTLGPFFRAFGISRTDTLRWIMVSKQSVGLGGTWTALDSTYAGPGGASIRLQILGKMEDTTVITDSAATPVQHHVYRTRTYRNIFVNGATTVSNASTSEIWLEPNVGPVQIHIYQDTENIGHFRVLRSKSF